MKKNMMIAQSGGPSSAINASIAGAIERALAADSIGTVYGAVNGMQGLLERRIISISDQIRAQDDIDMLIHTPAQALGSSRYKLPKDDPAVFDTILGILKDYGIGYFFYNGGNDSMDTVSRLSAYFKEKGEDIVALGIPKTIDNDLVETDHTPGFGSAARYVATSVAELYLDTIVYPLPSVVVVEIMGRNAGWLTAASALARDTGVPAPHLIYLPEVPFDFRSFLDKTEKLIASEGQILVAVSEGIRLENGNYIADTGAAADAFGHKTLGGVATVIEDRIKSELAIPKLKTRAIQFNTLQRAAAHCASAKDLEESYQCGYRAVEAALDGITDVMVTINRTSDEPYHAYYSLASLGGIANKEKSVPLEWIDAENADITEDFMRYARPLVRGEATEKFEGGLPRFFRFNWLDTV